MHKKRHHNLEEHKTSTQSNSKSQLQSNTNQNQNQSQSHSMWKTIQNSPSVIIPETRTKRILTIVRVSIRRICDCERVNERYI